jgi:hypothetical protein
MRCDASRRLTKAGGGGGIMRGRIIIMRGRRLLSHLGAARLRVLDDAHVSDLRTRGISYEFLRGGRRGGAPKRRRPGVLFRIYLSTLREKHEEVALVRLASDLHT